MTAQLKYNLINWLIALIWFINGLFCKVLNFVPRHEKIVASILGESFSRPLTIMIGMAELLMAIWIVSGIKPRWNAIIQITVIGTMNILEFFLAPELLLWGRFNFFFAIGLMLVIYLNEFVFRRKLINSTKS